MSEVNKESFLAIFKEHIVRDGANDLLDWLTRSDFFIAPASTRFHGNHEGGLLEHSLNVYNCLRYELDNEGASDKYSNETVAIVSLLHDLCKVNFYKQGFRNVKNEDGVWERVPTYEIDEKFPCGDHADKSIILIQQFMKLEPEEILAIRAHMGGYDNAVKGGSNHVGKIFERSKLALLLHIADMKATYLLEG